MSVTEHKYSGLRALIWPIARYELKKIIPMSLLLFCMLYNYTTVRILKDFLVVTTKEAGASVLPFLKTFVVLPSAILFVIIYSKISSRFEKSPVFYGTALVFGIFFFLFGNVFFPMADTIHMSKGKILALQQSYPLVKELVAIVGLWSYSAFYVMAELWGNVSITVLFWQFANQITPTNEAKRHYISYQSVANFALLIAASATDSLFPANVKIGSAAAISSVGMSCNIVSVLIVASILLYRYVNNKVITDPRFPVPETKAPKTKKKKPGLFESFLIVWRSKYLMLIAGLVIFYGISTNFVEIIWKDMMKIHSETSNVSYVGLQSSAFFWMGVASIVIATFGKGLVNILGWRNTALITPIGMLLTSVLFFASILMPDATSKLSAYFNLSVVGFGVMIGTMQQVFTKSAKYVMFDSTKEMAYIPLSEEEKVQGKSAVEVLGGRAGKSGGSMIQAGLLTIVTAIAGPATTMITLAPYLAVASVLIVLLWILCTFKLNVLYRAKLSEEVTKKAK